MNPQDLTNDIAAAPFLAGLNDQHIRVLAECACRTHFDDDQIIFHQGRIVVGSIERGGVLGWSWLFAPYEWQFTARSVGRTSALFFYGTVLREHCETDPSLGFELFKRMSEEMLKRLQSARRRLLELEAGGSPAGRREGHPELSGVFENEVPSSEK
jgi:CRP/FNR family transcriptional regulator, cyclic AMP receptor protein